MLTLDLLFVFDAYEWWSTLLAPGIRRLTAAEEALAREIFGDSLPYHLLRVDERAHIACRRYRIAYVSFLTVNAWGALSGPILQHELVHCWQYVHRGAAYIPRALWAQRTAFGYDYRGLAYLRHLAGDWEQLNYEQQGDLVADYCRIRAGQPAAWSQAVRADLPVYAVFLNHLRQPLPPSTPARIA